MFINKKEEVSTGMNDFMKRWLLVMSFFAIFIAGPAYSSAGDLSISRESIDILTKINQATAEIVEAVRPTVVNISTKRTIKVQENASPLLEDPFFRQFFGDRLRTPKERKTASLGSGVIVASDGYILTSNHVIQGAEEIKVTLYDKREYKGKIVAGDAMTDIGVIKIEADHLAAIKWGDSGKLRVGEKVFAIGSPYGLSQTVTMGIVSAVGRANVGIADYEDFIQSDAAINPGNSGGAMVNVRGELVGINTAIFSTSGGYQGIGFAVPTNMAKSVMDSLISKGKVIRGWLGVTIQSLTPELVKQLDLKEEKGVLVGDVVEGSPAETAGLLRGDVIILFDGRKIEDPNQLRNMVANIEPGKDVETHIVRENKTEIKKVTIGEVPSVLQKSAKAEYDNLLKGVIAQELTPEFYSKLNLPAKLKGVVVTDIDQESAAAAILIQGDVIQEINKQRITGMKEYERVVSMIKPGKDILLVIYRGGSSIFLTLSGR
jgi:serine protease Do